MAYAVEKIFVAALVHSNDHNGGAVRALGRAFRRVAHDVDVHHRRNDVVIGSHAGWKVASLPEDGLSSICAETVERWSRLICSQRSCLRKTGVPVMVPSSVAG